MILRYAKIEEFFLRLEINNIDNFAVTAKESCDIYTLLKVL